MKYIDHFVRCGSGICGKEQAIDAALTPTETRRGEIESLRDEVAHMRETLARFLAKHIHTADDLNNLCGYGRFTEVEE